MIVRSYELRDELNDLINQATSLLIEELQIPTINKMIPGFLGKDLNISAFNVKFCDMNGRVDASFYTPAVKAIIGTFGEICR